LTSRSLAPRTSRAHTSHRSKACLRAGPRAAAASIAAATCAAPITGAPFALTMLSKESPEAVQAPASARTAIAICRAAATAARCAEDQEAEAPHPTPYPSAIAAAAAPRCPPASHRSAAGPAYRRAVALHAALESRSASATSPDSSKACAAFECSSSSC